VERKRVPGHVLCEAERLECLLFGEYDPHFEGESLLGCEGKLGFSGVDRADAVVLAARFALDAVSESALLQWQNLVCLRASPLEW